MVVLTAWNRMPGQHIQSMPQKARTKQNASVLVKSGVQSNIAFLPVVVGVES